MKLRVLMISAILLTVGACGDSSDTPEADAPDETAAEVSIEVSGDQSLTFSSNGSLYCGESTMGGEPYYFELYAMQPPLQFNMRLPRQIQPGTHPVHGSDDPESNSESDGPVYFYWQGEDRVRFDQVSNGELVLESVPAARGERLVGQINAELTNDDGGSIQFKAELDVDAGAQSFDECP